MNYLFKIDDFFTDEFAALFASLMPKERYERFIKTQERIHKKQIVAAYLLLCYSIWNETAQTEIRLTFGYSPKGKPYLIGSKNTNFSISHSGEYVLCSISKNLVGNDIQKKASDITLDHVEAESIYKLLDGAILDDCSISFNTHVTSTENYLVAISGTSISKEIIEVKFKDLTTYLSKVTTIGSYLSFNAPPTIEKYPTPLSLFKESVARFPRKNAVSYKGEAITYQQLDAYSNNIAYRLKDAGVKVGDNVILAVSASIEFSIAELAIMKVGATYVPIYKYWPVERVNKIIETCRAKTMIISRSGTFSNANIENIVICEDYKSGNTIISIDESKNDTAYIVFTSGSSGVPKGVMVTKQNLSAFASRGQKSYYDLVLNVDNPRVACICALSFDMSIAENTVTLLLGGTVIFADDEDQRPEQFGKFLLENDINILWATPSKLRMYLKTNSCHESLKKLKSVVVAGEVLDVETAKLAKQFGFSLFNMYGPTETTIVSTCHNVDILESNIPIGKPLKDEQCYILSPDGRLCEIGEKGELCIAGDCVSKGYIANPELTNNSFTPNPFGKGYMYHTGDIAALEIDGNLRFYGRRDNQIKINGFRVEIEEIESVIKALTKRNVVVIYKSNQLIAVIESDKIIERIEERLQSKLPQYMIPSRIYYFPIFPKTVSDKIDRNKVMELINKDGQDIYVAAKTDLQQKIIEVWQEILQLKKIGVNDNFFYLGGDSIDAMRISARLKEFNIAVTSYEILRYKTPIAISMLIEQREKNSIVFKKNTINLLPKLASNNNVVSFEYLLDYQKNFQRCEINGTYLPLKMHKDIMESTSSCEFLLYKVEGTKDVDVVQSSLKNLIANNAALRTTYNKKKQECREHSFYNDWYIPVVKLSNISNNIKEVVYNISVKDGIQYLSYVIIALDEMGNIFVGIFLHWRFCDKTAQDILLVELNSFANLAHLDIAGFVSPLFYTKFIQKGNFAYKNHIPQDLQAYLDRFAVLSANDLINTSVSKVKNNHFVCSLKLSGYLYQKYESNPFDFVVSIYYAILKKIFGVNDIPIYCLERNRSITNEWLVDSVVDLFPLILGEGQTGYFSIIKRIRSYKRADELFTEKAPWNNSISLLPFVNCVSDSYNGDNEKLVPYDVFDFKIQQEVKADKNISCSSFTKGGELVLVFNVPLSVGNLSNVLKELITKDRLHDVA